jgi:hypothetical protein
MRTAGNKTTIRRVQRTSKNQKGEDIKKRYEGLIANRRAEC